MIFYYLIFVRNSEQFISNLLQLLEHLGRCPVQLLRQDPLLIEVERAKHLAKVAVYHVLDRCVETPEHDVVPPAERHCLDSEVHLEVAEEFNVFSRLEWDEGVDAAHGARGQNHFVATLWVQLRLENLSAELPCVELADRVHFESSPVQVAVLPLELRERGVILGIVLAARWKSIHIQILELVDTAHGILVEHAEVHRPSLEHVIRKDVELGVIWLVLEYVDALLHI